MCICSKLCLLAGGEFILRDERMTVRSSLIYPLKTAISTTSHYSRFLCNIFLSDLDAYFSVIKLLTVLCGLMKLQIHIFLQHSHHKEEKVTMGVETLRRAQLTGRTHF